MTFLRKTRWKFLPALMLGFGFTCQINAETIVLASNGIPGYSIVSSEIGSSTEKFANEELKKYLDQLSNSNFLFSDKLNNQSIVVGTVNSLQKIDPELYIHPLEEEEYGILKRGQNLYLAGGSDAAVLFVVYDFLSDLGCQWVAPDFDFFSGTNCKIPVRSELKFDFRQIQQKKPVFKYRKFYVEEGRSHSLESLKQLIDWMPKLRMNTLVFPIDYEGRGEVKWDNWRDELIPELRKRNILIEVGGHGYQNFINAMMEGGTLYVEHPEWFGLDDTGVRSKNPRMVICTSNNDAVNYMYGNLLDYLKCHAEIQLFDFWPPDSELWCSCEKCRTLGGEVERHILLVNQIAELLQKDLPEVQLECLAYNRYVKPTQRVKLNNNVLLDFCPINQNFEYQIFEKENERNEAYNDDLLLWMKTFEGDISIYTYFRKYAWRSLPNIIPHYMQNDLKYYQKLGIRGVSVYSESGDWFTYGVNHYVFSQLAWNPALSVDSLIEAYSNVVYGNAGSIAMIVYKELESIVRFACNIPHTTLKKSDEYNDYLRRINFCRQRVKSVMDENHTSVSFLRNLKRLDLMLIYANKSIHFMQSKVLKNNDQMNNFDAEIKEFLREHAHEGVFIPHKKL